MPEKDPMTYSLLTYIWVIGLSIWGGIAGYIRKLRTGVNTRFQLTDLIGEVVISGLVGVVTFWLCEASAINPLITAAMIGVSAHMGSRAIIMGELWVQSFFDRKYNIPRD